MSDQLATADLEYQPAPPVPPKAGPGRHARLMQWLLVGVGCLTPLVVVYIFIKPFIGQSYFFQFGTLLGALLLGLAWLRGAEQPPSRVTIPGLLMLLNVLSVAVSILVSRDLLYSLKTAMLPGCAALFWGLIIVTPGRRVILDRLAFGLVIVGVFLSIYGILQNLGYEFLPYSEQIRKNNVIATIGHPNYLGSVLGPTIFLALGLILSSPFRLRSLLLGVGVMLMLVCVTLARTRGIWLGIIVGAAMLFIGSFQYCRVHRLGLRPIAILLAGALAQLAAIVVFVFLILPRLDAGIDVQQLKERLASNMEIKSRLYYWKTSIDLGLEKPVFGQGYGMFNARFWETALAQQKSPEGPYYLDVMPSISGRMPGHVHNEYLEVFCEQGFVGLLVFLALLVFFVWFGWFGCMRITDRARAFREIGAYCAFFVILVDALFSFPLRLPVSLIITMLVLARLYDAIYPAPTVLVAPPPSSAALVDSPAVPEPSGVA